MPLENKLLGIYLQEEVRCKATENGSACGSLKNTYEIQIQFLNRCFVGQIKHPVSQPWTSRPIL
jgi:hypothetical protein